MSEDSCHLILQTGGSLLLQDGSSFLLLENCGIIINDGGFDGHHNKEYRKYIERLERATRQKEITKEVIEAAQQIDDLPLDLPNIELLASFDLLNQAAVNYQALQSEVLLLEQYIAKMIAFENWKKRQREEEMILLMALN